MTDYIATAYVFIFGEFIIYMVGFVIFASISYGIVYAISRIGE